MGIDEEAAAHLGRVIADNVVPFRHKTNSRVRAKPPPPVTINGFGNIVGNGNTLIVRAPRTVIRAKVEPGAIHIDDAQAARLQHLVREVAQVSGKSHQFVWTRVNHHASVPSYRLIPAVAFTDVEKYLVKWIGSSPTRVGDERRRHLAYIKIAQAAAKKSDAVIEAFLLDNFQKVSLSKCTIEELQTVRDRLVSGWKKASSKG